MILIIILISEKGQVFGPKLLKYFWKVKIFKYYPNEKSNWWIIEIELNSKLVRGYVHKSKIISAENDKIPQMKVSKVILS